MFYSVGSVRMVFLWPERSERTLVGVPYHVSLATKYVTQPKHIYTHIEACLRLGTRIIMEE